MPEASELTQADRDTLAQAALRVVHQLYIEFPDMRLFPKMVHGVCVDMVAALCATGLGHEEVMDLLASPAGSIAIAGSVYGHLNGHMVGADARAIEHGML